MEKGEEQNFFIIERLDASEESDVISNVYDLSILNKVKERKKNKNSKIKQYFKNIIRSDETKKISQEKKIEIIQAVKKAILSSNLTYKWKLVTFKQILIFVHIIFFISTITHSINEKSENNIFNLLLNNNTNPEYNVIINYNNSMNITNISDNNLYFINKTSDLNNKRKINISFALILIIKQISIIPIWFIFKFKYIPKWNKANDILHKFTSYLLLCESYKSKYYFYYLMKDFSILVTTKQYYYEHKELFPFSSPKYEYIYEKNIILYSINIISDFILEQPTSFNYYELISIDDYANIKLLNKYVENNLKEKLKNFNRKILSPVMIGLLIAILYSKPSLVYTICSITLLFLIFLISGYIFKEYIKIYKLNIDSFIDSFNDLLLKKNRFIYRKNKLMMYLALKENNYTKEQIINIVGKIVNL